MNLTEKFAQIREAQGFGGAASYAKFCTPLLEALDQAKMPLLMGLSGAQGSGKTNLAQALSRLLMAERGLRVLVLSLDDFYLTQTERKTLGQEVHPLAATRGVPGTHDLVLLQAAIHAALGGGPVVVPRFDKSKDDRAGFTELKGPFDLVIFEGWCLGAKPQGMPRKPINALEAQEDSQGVWRSWVEARLEAYQPLFSQVGLWAFLAAPDWPIVAKWRKAQEMDLKKAGRAAPMLEPGVLDRFMMFYQGISLRLLEQMPQQADWCGFLDADQRIVSIRTGFK